MFYQERKKFRKVIFIGWAVSVFIFLSACAANKAVKKDVTEGDKPAAESGSKLITDIVIEDGKDPVTVSIQGNQLLTYTPVKQPLPLGLVLYFPETSLGIAKREYQVESDIVASVEAVELIENGPSKVTISLKADSEPVINRSGNGLVISFSQNAQPSEEDQSSPDAAGLDQSAENPEFVAEQATAPEMSEAQQDPDGTAEDSVVEEIPIVSAPAVEAATAGVGAVSAAELPQQPAASVSGENNFREISSVNADDGVSVLIRSDLSITDYKDFTLSNPPRIVLDLNNVKSSYKKQQTIPINSKWVSSVRHFAYPEKLRVVLDTTPEYLSSYTVEPSENGLIVMVADSIEPQAAVAEAPAASAEPEVAPQPIIVEEAPMQEEAAVEMAAAETGAVAASADMAAATTVASSAVETETAEPAASVAVEPEPVPAKAALVNRIDFLSGDEGKSTIIIGTTRPITYDLEKTDALKLSLDLFDTKILSYRQRPLITTRFESAVNRIIPVQTEGMLNNSKVVIELREAVPYTVEQNENEIEISFQASSIPPKSLEEAGLPPWEKVMEKAALEAEAKIAKVEPEMPEGMPQGATPGMMEAPAIEESAMKPEEESQEVAVAAEPTEMPAAPMEDSAIELPGTEAPTADIAVDETMLPELAEEESEPAAEEAEKKAAKTRKRYTGEKIALDFYQTDIKNVLRILRDVSGKNFAIDKDVSGNVTLTLVKPIPWDQVLDLILKMNQLGRIEEGDIVRIVTISTLRKEEKIRADELKAAQSIQEQQKALEPLVTEYIPINYADATKDIKPRLDQIKTAKRGQVGVDTRNNQIIMSDTAEKIAQAKEIIRSIDKVTPQVVIEARIVEVSETFSRDIGTEWGVTAGPDINGSDSQTYTMAMNHPPSSSSGSIGYQFSRLAGTNFSLNAELQAVEAAGEGKIISTPKIVTLDNKEAVISQGIEYPYLERDSSGLSTTKFKDIDLELKVKPHVTPDNRINLTIDITKDDIGTITGGVPSLNTNEAKTELLVNDGDTIVIGGILKTNAAESESRFPLLSRIPILGWMFKSKGTSNTKNELLIFITPKIVHLESGL